MCLKVEPYVVHYKAVLSIQQCYCADKEDNARTRKLNGLHNTCFVSNVRIGIKM